MYPVTVSSLQPLIDGQTILQSEQSEQAFVLQNYTHYYTKIKTDMEFLHNCHVRVEQDFLRIPQLFGNH